MLVVWAVTRHVPPPAHQAPQGPLRLPCLTLPSSFCCCVPCSVIFPIWMWRRVYKHSRRTAWFLETLNLLSFLLVRT